MTEGFQRIVPRPYPAFVAWMAPALLGGACALSGWGASEGIFVALLFALACIMWAVDVLMCRAVVFPAALPAYVGWALLLVACVSTLVSGAPLLMSLFGTAFGVGTPGLFIAFALAIVFCASGRGSAAFLYSFETVTMLRALALFFEILAHRSFSGDFFWLTVIGFAVCAFVALAALGAARTLQMDFFHGVVALSCILALGALFVSNGAAVIRMFPGQVPTISVSDQILGPQELRSLQYAFIGSGPGSFGDVWNMRRPLSTNATALWKSTPDSAGDTPITFAVTLGLLGLFAFLICPFVLLYELFRHRLRGPRSSSGSAQFMPVLTLAILSFAASFAYPIGSSLFLASGAALGYFLYLTDASRARIAEFSPNIRAPIAFAMFGIAAGIILVCMLQLIALLADERGHGLPASQQAIAATEFQEAAKTWPDPDYMKDAAQGTIAAAIQTANTQSANGSVDGTLLSQDIQKASSYADVSIKAHGDPNGTDLWIARASVYLSAASMGVASGTEVAQESLNSAQADAPTRPDIYYDEAVLAIFQGDTGLARADLYKALILKPDYQGAQNLLSTLGS